MMKREVNPFRRTAVAMALLACAILASVGDAVAQSTHETPSRLDWIFQQQAKFSLDQVADRDSLKFYIDLERWLLAGEGHMVSHIGEMDSHERQSLTRSDSLVWMAMVRSYLGLTSGPLGPVALPQFETMRSLENRGTLQRTLRRSINRTEREEAYRRLYGTGLRDISEREQALVDRATALSILSRINQFSSLDLLFEGESLDLATTLHALDSATMGPYQDVKRSLLNDERPEIWDLGLYRARASAGSETKFPADSLIDLVQQTFAMLGFDLEAMPLYYELEINEQVGTDLRVVPIESPYDLRITGMLGSGLSSLSELMGSVGEAVYLSEITEKDQAFRLLIDPAWKESIHAFFANLCYTPWWLAAVGGYGQGEVERVSRAADDAVLVELRLYLAEALFDFDLISGKSIEVNRTYWQKMLETLDIPRHPDLSPWAYEPALGLGLTRLTGHLAGDHLIEYVEREYFDSGRADEVRAFLVHNLFRYGARYPWNDVLTRATGTSALSTL